MDASKLDYVDGNRLFWNIFPFVQRRRCVLLNPALWLSARGPRALARWLLGA